MIVVAIIALLAAIAVPGFLRSRKRSQASRVVNDLRLIDAAVDQYAIENNKATGATVGTASWTAYMKKNSQLYNTAGDLFGNTYGPKNRGHASESPGGHVEHAVRRCGHQLLLALRAFLIRLAKKRKSCAITSACTGFAQLEYVEHGVITEFRRLY